MSLLQGWASECPFRVWKRSQGAHLDTNIPPSHIPLLKKKSWVISPQTLVAFLSTKIEGLLILWPGASDSAS